MKNRMKIVSLVCLAILGTLLLAPVSPIFAAIYLIGTLTSPFWGHMLPSGILGENPPVMTEADFLVKIKSKIEEGTVELKTKITKLEEKNAEFKTLSDKLIELEAKSKDLKDVEEFKTLAKECS